MQFQQPFAPSRPPGEVVVEGDSRKLPAQVELVSFAVGGVVQDGVDVIEDVCFGDVMFLEVSIRSVASLGDTSGHFCFAVVRPELCQAPIGDVLEPVAGFVIAVEGKALRFFQKVE